MDVRREHFYRDRAFRERSRSLSIVVKWWPHDDEQSEVHPVYDESGDAVYRPARLIPALWWFDEEGGDQLTAEGRTLYRRGNFGFASSEFTNVGLTPDPDERLNDMIQWDGWFWEVIEFDLTSNTSNALAQEKSQGSSIRVAVKRRFPESDMPHDTFPAGEWQPGPWLPGEEEVGGIEGGGASSDPTEVFDGGSA